jgi:hypothetical protein
MSEDRFLDRVRHDARELRYEAGEAVLTRVSARIRERIGQPTVSEFLAAWFRPLAASLSALALVATIGLTLFERSEALAMTGDTVEVSMGGDVYRVAD